MAKEKETKVEGGYDFDNYEKDILTRAKNLGWNNWQKWTKVGDKIQGYVADAFFKAGDDTYEAARGITIKTLAGEYVNVSIKRLPFILSDTDNLRIGDPLTIKFTEEKDNGKGKFATKILGFYGTNTPETIGNKTVKQLDDEDQKAGGTVAPVATEDGSDAELNELAGDDVPDLS